MIKKINWSSQVPGGVQGCEELGHAAPLDSSESMAAILGQDLLYS